MSPIEPAAPEDFGDAATRRYGDTAIIALN
jgi:hypothetical protein